MLGISRTVDMNLANYSLINQGLVSKLLRVYISINIIYVNYVQ